MLLCQPFLPQRVLPPRRLYKQRLRAMSVYSFRVFFFFGSPEGLTLALEASLFVLVQVFWMPLGNEGIRLCPGKGELLVVARVSFSRVCSTMLYREEGANGPWVCRRGETFRPRGLRLRPLVSSRG